MLRIITHRCATSIIRRHTYVHPPVSLSLLVKRKFMDFGPGMIRADTDEELICCYEDFFNRDDIDGWELRKGLNDLHGLDLVPDPRIICAGLRACRRNNDYALAIRFLEAVKFKCGNQVNKIYPYILQEITPTLKELGVDTPEDLGYDKPELYVLRPEEIF